MARRGGWAATALFYDAEGKLVGKRRLRARNLTLHIPADMPFPASATYARLSCDGFGVDASLTIHPAGAAP